MTSTMGGTGAPELIVDHTNQKTYTKGSFLGKGGFAKCYEIKDSSTNKIYAGKIVSKSLLVKPHQIDKMKQEIAIHRSLDHKYIVGFHGFFEDAQNVYIVLELCKRRSLMELHRRRRSITEPEARYFMHQITTACNYLHSKNIIHRDLKLGNLFLDGRMEIKVGDFGLATKVEFNGERKKTLCGTPNYLAPEVLQKIGHSFEVDVWSLGCILYTFLIGRPPFETPNLQDTYSRIKKNDYKIPPGTVSDSARNLIEKMLRAEPSLRPTMKQILQDPFFTSGYHPQTLPTSCLSVAPRFAPSMGNGEPTKTPLAERKENGIDLSPVNMAKEQQDKPGEKEKAPEKMNININKLSGDGSNFLSNLMALLGPILKSKNFGCLSCDHDDAEDPAAVPIFWVSKWVDYSDKYGIGYQLCDDSCGVLFNDSSRIILANSGENIQYIEKDGLEHLHSLNSYPNSLYKKITLLKYFNTYMKENLVKAGGDMTPREDMTRLPLLSRWFRNKNAIALYLSNGTLQINFFEDHVKVIMCPLMEAVTLIDEDKSSRTFRFSLIENYGCSEKLATCLRFGARVIKKMSAMK